MPAPKIYKNKIRLIIEYDSLKGGTVPDGLVHRSVENVIYTSKIESLTNHEPIRIVVGSVVLFDAFRISIRKKKIKNTEVKLLYKNVYYDFDEEGNIMSMGKYVWPKGMCNTYDEILEELVLWRYVEND